MFLIVILEVLTSSGSYGERKSGGCAYIFQFPKELSHSTLKGSEEIFILSITHNVPHYTP